MFKSKEELMKETCSDDIEELKITSMKLEHNEKLACDMGISFGIDKAFKSIAERIDVYETRWNKELFVEKYPDIWDLFCSYIKSLGKDKIRYFAQLEKGIDKIFYDWLFDFCFDGVE